MPKTWDPKSLLVAYLTPMLGSKSLGLADGITELLDKQGYEIVRKKEKRFKWLKKH